MVSRGFFPKLDKPQNLRHGIDRQEQLEFERVRANQTLGLQCIPYFGIYGKR